MSEKRIKPSKIVCSGGSWSPLSVKELSENFFHCNKVKLPKGVPLDILHTSKFGWIWMQSERKNLEFKLTEKFDSNIKALIDKDVLLQAELYVVGDSLKLKEAKDIVTD